jgi:hypothetical protein
LREGASQLDCTGDNIRSYVPQPAVNKLYCIGFKVLTAMTMKSTIVCDVTPCSPAEVHGVASQEKILFKIIIQLARAR